MKEKRNLHLKVQELCDCYATTDPLQEMSRLPEGTDKEEEAEEWNPNKNLDAYTYVTDNSHTNSYCRSKYNRLTNTNE